ncbi:HET-domain-containing protein [Paramyrothecium foliicola]|nr:HET-domain-containing protein [Paramyrothecium foliicola]
MPTRLVDLGNGEQPTPILIENAALDCSAEYTALSHRWHSSTLENSSTTNGNISAHRSGIGFGSLPRTYQDAMIVTKTLRFHFIWIDSLCIIQGDEIDWAREFSLMSEVFHGAALVLAPVTSPDTQEGCFLDSVAQPAYYQYSTQEGEHSIELRVPVLKPNLVPLSKRAWVLQETLLARRLVFFTDNQLYWQCRTCSQFEDGFIRNNYDYQITNDSCIRPHTFGDSKRARDYWWTWVGDYTSREFSYGSEWMAALAGLTHYFSEQTGLQPLLGLWNDELLGVDLGWSLYDRVGHIEENTGHHPHGFKLSELGSLPSWSWFRYQMPIFSHMMASRCVASDISVVDIDIRWGGKPFTSRLVNARLIVSGRKNDLLLKSQRKSLQKSEMCKLGQNPLTCLLDHELPRGVEEGVELRLHVCYCHYSLRKGLERFSSWRKCLVRMSNGDHTAE